MRETSPGPRPALWSKGEIFWRDVCHSSRILRKSLGFTLIVLVTLALGIGANTALFSIVSAALLRPLPYAEPQRLVWVTKLIPQLNAEIVTGEDYLDWDLQTGAFEAMAAVQPSNSFNLTNPGEPERIQAARISSNFLSVLGVPLEQGRSIAQTEDRAGGNPVAVVTHLFWQRRFGLQAPLTNQTIALDGKNFSVIGILPPAFRFPQHPETQVLIPLALDPVQERGGEQSTIIDIIGRLRVGTTMDRARAELEAISRRRQASGPSPFPKIEVMGLHDYFVGNIRPGLLLLFAAAAVVLLICCFNIANLLLARSASRQKEFAIRAALGARRGRLTNQILTESCLLGLLGGGLGLLIAQEGTRLFLIFPASRSLNSFLEQIHPRMDGQVLLFAFVLSLLTGLLFGILPALLTSRTNLTDSLKGSGQSWMAGPHSNRTRNWLVVAQIALALMLLAEAGLLLKSLYRLMEVDPGFQPQNVLTLTLQLPQAKYPAYSRRASFFQQLSQRLTSLPSVQAVGLTDSLPLSGNSTALFALTAEGQPSLPIGKRPPVSMIAASPNCFHALGIYLVRGRSFTRNDTKDAPPVAIVSTAMAEHFWGKNDPLGKRLKKGFVGPWLTVVGVVGDVHHSGLDANSAMTLYVPILQTDMTGPISVAIRSQENSSGVVSAVREEIRSLDSELPIYDIATMEQRLSTSVSPHEFNALLVAIFAGLALALATVGIYGVISLTVAQRTHEVGVRMALGAQPSDVTRLILLNGIEMVLTGTAIGIAGTFALTRLMKNFLFRVSATDPATFVGVALVFSIVAIVACYIPAKRATKVDPIVALRYE